MQAQPLKVGGRHSHPFAFSSDVATSSETDRAAVGNRRQSAADKGTYRGRPSRDLPSPARRARGQVNTRALESKQKGVG